MRSLRSGASFVPPQRQDLVTLLDALVFDKALYELHYELNNRLDWVRIPLQSVLRLLEGPRGQPSIT